METSLIIILITILLSAFFSGMEMAFVSSNKLKVEIDKNRNNIQARLLSIVTRQPSRYIGTMLIGNNIMLVIYGLLMAALLEPWLKDVYSSWGYSGEAWVIISQTVLSTLLILVTGEFLPKALFGINPNRSLNIFILPVTLFYYLLHIPVTVTVYISKVLLKYIFRIPLQEEEVSLERTDLNYYLSQVRFEKQDPQETLDNEVKILQNVLDFPSVKARECMVPRNEIIAIEVHESVEELMKLFIESGLSRIMVYRDTIDDIIGFVHLLEMFKKPVNIQAVIMPVMFVPETMLVKDILTQFIQQHRSMAVVVDEYGGTSGILTTEDIIEEIFGEIEDEHDVENHTEKMISDREYIFSGRLEIDYLNETYHLGLPEREEYTTLAGLILFHEQDIPEVNHVVEIEGFKFIINRVSAHRIEEVTVHLIKS
jgi:CBS domain containing-hemolysin-like protein